jgi:antitoxin ParD1/3/4
VRLITLYLPEGYVRALDRLVADGFYPSRAEAIRFAVRDLLYSEVWGKSCVKSVVAEGNRCEF